MALTDATKTQLLGAMGDPSSTQNLIDYIAQQGSGDIKSDGTVPFAADQSMGSHKITNLSDPVSAQDAATKAYVLANAGSGTVTNVSGSGNIASSGGTTPNITFTGTLPIANGGTNNASLSVAAGTIFYGDGSKLVALASGSASQVLQSNGAGAPSWVAASAGSPGGPSNSVQYNNGGVFGGSSSFLFGVNGASVSFIVGSTGTVYLNSDGTHPNEIGVTGISSSFPMNTPIIFSGSSLPAPLVAGTTYYSNGGFCGTGLGANSIYVWATTNGSPIHLTSTGSGTITITQFTNEVQLGVNLDMNSHNIINVTDPSSAQDAATKHYVDNHGVSSLNSETGAVNITAGTNITVTPSGQNIQISATAGFADVSARAYHVPGGANIGNSLGLVKYDIVQYGGTWYNQNGNDYSYKAAVAGKYKVNASALVAGSVAGDIVVIEIWLNGAAVSSNSFFLDAVNLDAQAIIADTVLCAINDVITIMASCSSISPSIVSSNTKNVLSIDRIA